MSLALPPNPRRAMVRSFGLVVSAIAGASVAVILALIRAPLSPLWGLLVLVVLAALVFMQEELVRRLYEAWNEHLVNPFAGIARAAIVRIVFYTVFVVAGRGRSERAGLSARGSVWTPRVSLDPADYSMLSGKSGQSFSWRREYRLWAAQSGNAWALAILPFLLLLRICSVPEAKSAESHIYTLF